MSGDQIWADGSLSILLLPAGEEGRNLLQVARAWTASWLLTPAMWVRAEDVMATREGPPEIPALVLGRNTQGEAEEVGVELFWKLGEAERSRVRLVAVRMLQTTEDQRTTSEAVERLANYLARAMPAQDAAVRSNEAQRNLIRLNLIIDAAEEAGLSGRQVFQPEWEANIVASPEDRAAPNTPDAPPVSPRVVHRRGDLPIVGWVGRPDRYYGWAMAHIGTAAGLWAGASRSVYDVSVGRPGVAHSLCLVQRVTVRGVLSEGLALELALETLTESASSDPSSQQLQQEALQRHHIGVLSAEAVPERSDAMTRYAIEQFVGQGFGYRTFDESEPRRQRSEVSLGSRVSLFLSLLGRGVLALPRFLAQLLLRRLSSLLTVEGGDAKVVAEMTWNGGLPHVDQGLFAIPAFEESVPEAPQTSPLLWRELRQLALASCDASETSKETAAVLTSSGSGRISVFPTRTSSIPDPTSVWTPPQSTNPAIEMMDDLTWADAEGAAAQLAQLEKHIELSEPLVRDAARHLQLAVAEVRRHERTIDSLSRKCATARQAAVRAAEMSEATRADHPHTFHRPAQLSEEAHSAS